MSEFQTLPKIALYFKINIGRTYVRISHTAKIDFLSEELMSKSHTHYQNRLDIQNK